MPVKGIRLRLGQNEPGKKLDIAAEKSDNNNIMNRKLLWMVAAWLFVFGFETSARFGDDQEKGKAGLVFQQSFKDEIKGFYLAKTSGELMVHGTEWVEYYDSAGKLLWKKTGFKYVCGGGVSRDGNTILFQTSAESKTQQTLADLTVHLVDRTGKELITKPNPHRYFTSILSPQGHYIVFGDQMAKNIYVYDQELNPLWERDTWLWYIGFDIEDQFVFDSTLGLILNNQGRRVWELPSGTRILSISKDADILLSQRFLTSKARNEIYLTSRKTAQQSVLEGYSAGVSFDGSLTAYQDMDRKIRVYRTSELLGKISGGLQDLSPLWKGDMFLVKLLQFSMDNSKLVVYGENSQRKGKIMEIDLAGSKTIWSKDWLGEAPLNIAVSEDGQNLAVQRTSQIEYFRMK